MAGFRDIDLAFDFERAKSTYKKSKEYYAGFLQEAKHSTVFKPMLYAMYIKPPTDCQRKAIELAKQVIEDTKHNKPSVYIMRGSGGVGKSNVFFSIANILTQKNIPFMIASPVGISCIQFNSCTVHSFLGIRNVKQDYKKMITADVSPAVSERIRKLQILMIDEIFLLNAKMFTVLIERIKFIKRTNNNPPITLICGGDDFQLTLPGGVPLHTCPDASIHDEMTLQALNIISNAKYKITMTTNVRQMSDPCYKDILVRLHKKQTTLDDISKLSTRLAQHLSVSEVLAFLDSIHIFSTNVKADAWNEYYLSQSSYSLRPIRPSTTPNCDQCELLFPHSFLGKNVPIFLTRNLIVQCNLVNGSTGYVEELYFENKKQPLPTFITIRIPKYHGIRLAEDGSIPITSLEETVWCPHSLKTIKVTYYPIKNNQSRTVYKIQGCTLDSVVVDLNGFRVNDTPALYTALSRCTSIDKLLIHSKRPLKDFFDHFKNGSCSGYEM